MTANPTVREDAVIGPPWFASRRTGLLLGVSTLLLIAVSVIESSLGAGGGTWIALIPFLIVGALVARRQPGNPVGPVLLLVTLVVVAAGDGAGYGILRYRLGYHALPLAQVAAVVGTPGPWEWLVVLLPLPIALFPDGRLLPGWRRALWGYLAVSAIFVGTNAWQAVGGLHTRPIQVNSQGQLETTGGSLGGTLVTVLLIGSYLGFCLAWVLRLVFAYRRSSGDYRQQLKWLAIGGAICLSGLVLVTVLSNTGSNILRAIGTVGLVVGLVALPVSFGVAILRYRLYEIDRLVSRTISYLLVTGLLAGVFLSLTVLTTRVLPFSSPVGVAASTLAAAALFNPLRKRIQRLVDRRFNRSRYDAEATVTAFRTRLREALDLETVQHQLLQTVDRAIEPTHSSLWTRPTGSTPHE